jgi:hypothetical protein
MWRFEPFKDFLLDLSGHPLISTILLYDNDKERRPNLFYCDKIRHIQNGTNRGVNPIWNEGVKCSPTELVCILNDDVIFDLRLFRKVLEFKDHWTIMGLCAGDPIHNQTPLTTGEINIVRSHGESTFGFGQLMMVKKSSWLPIPDDLLLYYGDQWAFETTQFINRPIHIIQNLMFRTPCAVTTSEVGGSEILGREGIIYYDHFRRFKEQLRT